MYKNSFNIETPDNTEDSLQKWVDALDEQYVNEMMTTSFGGKQKNHLGTKTSTADLASAHCETVEIGCKVFVVYQIIGF